jgi:hypothetical protein
VKQQDKKPPEGSIEYFTEAVIVGHDVNTPDVEPLFANHFELLTMGTDVYLDVGIIDPKDMTEMVLKAQENPSDPKPTVKFSVIQRVAMSPATFILLANKVNATLQNLQMLKESNARERSKISK